MTQNISGIPSYKIKFYREIFLPLIRSKNKKDEKDGKEEKIIAVTTKELADYYKEKTGKAISTDNLRKTILVELLNNDYIGELKSELDSRQFIYYPLLEFDDSQKIEINLTENKSNEEENISKLSNLSEFDNYLHVSPIKLPKNCKNIQKDWLIYEIVGLVKYRIDLDNFRGPLADFLNNHDEFQLLNDKGKRLRIKEFVEEYEKNLKLIRYFFKPEFSNYRNNLFGDIKLLHKSIDKNCNKLSNQPKFDNKDILYPPIKSEVIEEIIDDDNDNNNAFQKLSEPSLLISCHYCNYTSNNEKDVEKHSVNAHPGKPARPDPDLLELMQQKKNMDKDDS